MRLTHKTKERLQMLRSLMLDERTKVRMRDALDAYADLHTLHAPVPARAGYAVRSPFSYLFTRAGYGVLAFALILLVGGGTAAYASEGSVPGSALYPVKVSIIEPVQGALITSPEGQASWHATLASRRLDEATTLAADNKLDPATQTYLQSKFEAEVNASDQAATIVADSGNTDAALDARSDLEAQITAHAEILNLITNHLAATATSTNPTLTGTRALLAAVEARRQEAVIERLALEQQDRAGHTDSSATSGVTLAIAEATTQSADSEARVKKAASFAPVAAPLGMAKSALREAKVAASSGNEATSSDDAHEAQRASEVATILLQHASLLQQFAPVGTTTASTTATTTKATVAATTTEDLQN